MGFITFLSNLIGLITYKQYLTFWSLSWNGWLHTCIITRLQVCITSKFQLSNDIMTLLDHVYFVHPSTDILIDISTDTRPMTINGQRMGRVSAAVSTITWSISWLIHRFIRRLTHLGHNISRESVDMSTNISVNTRPICQPIHRSSVSWCTKYTWSTLPTDGVVLKCTKIK